MNISKTLLSAILLLPAFCNAAIDENGQSIYASAYLYNYIFGETVRLKTKSASIKCPAIYEFVDIYKIAIEFDKPVNADYVDELLAFLERIKLTLIPQDPKIQLILLSTPELQTINGKTIACFSTTVNPVDWEKLLTEANARKGAFKGTIMKDKVRNVKRSIFSLF